MFSWFKKYGLFTVFLVLLVLTISIFYQDYKHSEQELTFAMFDVGQGDALFLESPSGVQILIDGGPPRKILGHLRQIMHPLDREIDALVITNPDQDHIGGLLDVLKTYKVGAVFEPGTFKDSAAYKNLKTIVEDKNIENIFARRGMRLNLGQGAILDILFPDRDVSDWTTNDGSVVARLSHGNLSIMLTGDSTSETERVVMEGNSTEEIKSTILKVGHHGSRTSTSPNFVEAVSPMFALISNGKDNSYGHPHKETLETLTASGVEILRTDTSGTLVLKSDGNKLFITSKR